MKLYDMPENNSRQSPEEIDSGEKFRSEQVYRCSTCYSRSNLWKDKGRYSPGIKCPVNNYTTQSRVVRNKPYFKNVAEVEEAKQKHRHLKKAIAQKRELKQEAKLYDVGEVNIPSRVTEELEVINQVITHLREWFDGRCDDVVGLDDDGDWEIEGEFSG